MSPFPPFIAFDGFTGGVYVAGMPVSVPEPSTFSLLLPAAAAGLMRHKRKSA